MSTVPRTTRSRVRCFESNIEFNTVSSKGKRFLGLAIEIVLELYREAVTMGVVWKAVNDLCGTKLCSLNPFTSWEPSQHCEKRLLTSSCLSVCQSARHNSAPPRGIFNKCCTWAFFENISREFKCDWNMTRITSNWHEDVSTLVIISLWILLILRNVSDKLCVENYTLYFTFNDFLNENRSYFLDNVEKYCRGRQATDDNRFACRINWGKNRDTHSEYAILLLFYWNIAYSNASQCYVICTLPVLFLILVAFILSFAILRT
jgi:hypothetical protein